jgi:hypothetical protein
MQPLATLHMKDDRDPQAIGNFLFEAKQRNSNRPLSKLYDNVARGVLFANFGESREHYEARAVCALSFNSNGSGNSH